MLNYNSKSKDTCFCHMASVSSKNRYRNLYECLEILENTSDIHLLTTIFSTLGIYVLSENVGDEIIKCEPLYEKLYFVLNCGLQAKTTITLNFISALLHIDEDGLTRKRTLYIYTQNMLRSSGCLTAMSNLLASFMLHQETLKALCLSISEAVRDSPANQSFCSHLVPLCIQKCLKGCWETFLVLQSLLNKHNRNVKFFHECNGMAIFTRISIQKTLSLPLINTVLEYTKNEDKEHILNSSHIFEYLWHHLQKYGYSTTAGQWASIILYSYQKVYKKNMNMKSILEDRHEHKTHAISIRKKTIEWPTSPIFSETNVLFQNILNEVIVSQRQGTLNKNKNNPTKCLKTQTQNVHQIGDNSKNQQKNFLHDNDLSFSFLLKEIASKHGIYTNDNQPMNVSKYNSKSIYNYQDMVENSRKNNTCNVVPNKYIDELNKNKTFLGKLRRNESFLGSAEGNSMIDFEPHFVSTPKKENVTFNSRSLSSRRHLSILASSKVTTTSREPSKSVMYRTKLTHKIIKSKHKTLQNKSMTAKFFNIVNASCTTIAKSFNTFRNIFKSNKASEISEKNNCIVEVDTSCSYSFTNYMRERDAMSVKNNKKTLGVTENESFASFQAIAKDCNTCNDTTALKQKLVNNASLQRTIKKLKIGINLYGCDFKKISRNMWPNESYMTPSVLYNLYRKLIIK